MPLPTPCVDPGVAARANLRAADRRSASDVPRRATADFASTPVVCVIVFGCCNPSLTGPLLAVGFGRSKLSDTLQEPPTRRVELSPPASSERGFIWVQRLVWPLVAYMSAQVAYWIWFDATYVEQWPSLIASFAFIIVALLAVFWAFNSWSAGDDP
jgi:hypothetical protein